VAQLHDTAEVRWTERLVSSRSVTASEPDPKDVARLYYRLFNERRLDEAGQLVDPEAVIHYVPTNQRLRGRAGYRALAAMWLNAFEDGLVEVVSLRLLDDSTVEADLLGRGTHTGDLVLGDVLTIPASGRHAELPFREVLHVRNGLIQTLRLEFDVGRMQQRLKPNA
jgi:predicted ester cyclase